MCIEGKEPGLRHHKVIMIWPFSSKSGKMIWNSYGIDQTWTIITRIYRPIAKTETTLPRRVLVTQKLWRGLKPQTQNPLTGRLADRFLHGTIFRFRLKKEKTRPKKKIAERIVEKWTATLHRAVEHCAWVCRCHVFICPSTPPLMVRRRDSDPFGVRVCVDLEAPRAL